MLVLCLGATFALACTATSPALAACKKGQHEYGTTCETEAEHANFLTFANCPFGAPPYNEEFPRGLASCVGGESFYRETWKSKKQREEWEGSHGGPPPGLLSHFTAGKVTVNLAVPITLRGGFEENENPIVGQEDEILWVAARGAATIQPEPQPSISLAKGVNKSLLSESELQRFDYYVKNAKQTKTTATVELAGPAERIRLNLENQLSEQGTAFVFPVKVKLSNPFLGEECYVGSNTNPIDVPFSTGQSGELHGKLGAVTTENGGDVLAIWGDTLVSGEYASPGVENCGIEGGADAAVNSALGLPAPTGNTAILNGVLKLSAAETAQEGVEGRI